MSNGQDNSGKPSVPPGPGWPLPRVTAPGRPGIVPPISAAPVRVPTDSSEAATPKPGPVPPDPRPPQITAAGTPRPALPPQPPASRPLPTISAPVAAPMNLLPQVRSPVGPPAVRASVPPPPPAVGQQRPVPAITVQTVIVPPRKVIVPPVMVPVAPKPAPPPIAPVTAPPVMSPRPALNPPVASAPRPAAIIPPAPFFTPPDTGAPRPNAPPPAPVRAAGPGALIPPVAPQVGPAVAPPAPPRPSPFPATGAVETIDPQKAAALRKLALSLNALDYFQTLSLAQTATPGEIKKAFYRESRTYHPDRFFHLADSQEKRDIGSIYKRVTESYYVLRDDTKRKKYLADLASAERSTKLRYTDATESELKAEARKTVEEEFGTNPKARPFFKTAVAEFEKGNLQGSQSALKMGLTYEPGNARFKQMLVDVQKKIEDARCGQAPSFMIK